MKGSGKIWWDEEKRIYTSEGEVWIVYNRMMDSVKEDEDVVAGIYCIHRAIQCAW